MHTKKLEPKVLERIEYISNLRALAILMVVFLHSSSPLFYQYGNIKASYWNITNFYDSSVRAAVPLFLMISGALTLGRDRGFLDFFKSFMTRLVVPFLFYFLVFSFYNHSSLKYILDPGKAYYHLYFIPIIFSLYLSYPIISVWIKSAKNTEISLVLILWAISSVSTSIFNLDNFKLVNLSFFGGFLGYPILGYLLSNREIFKKYLRIEYLVIVPIIFYISGLLMTFFLTYQIVKDLNMPNEKFYGYLTPNVLLMAVGIFSGLIR